MKTMNNKNNLYKEKLIEGNLEYDYLDLDRIEFNTDVGKEKQFVVPQHLENRLDLISYKAYGTTELWWLICMRNDINDPFTEIKTGMILFIPSLRDYYSYYYSTVTVDDTYKNKTFEKRQLK